MDLKYLEMTKKQKQQVKEWYGREILNEEKSYTYYFKNGIIKYAK